MSTAVPVAPAPLVAPAAAPPPLSVQVLAVLAMLHASGAFFALVVAEGDTPPAVLLVWVALYAAGAAGLLDGLLRRRLRPPLPPVLLALVALATASVLWSQDPALTTRRAVGLAGTVVVALLLAQRMRPVDLLDALRRAMVVIAVASLLLLAVGGGAALDEVHGTLRGVVATKNALGRDMALGVLACVGLLLLDRGSVRRTALSVPPMLAALALTDSTAGVLLAVLALLAGGVATAAGRAAGKVLLVGVAALLVGLTAITLPAASPEQLTAAVGEDTTLTGRDVVWAESAGAAAREAVLGHGYGAFWASTDAAEAIRGRLGWDVPHAHNGLLDVVLDLGVVGGALVLLLVVGTAVRGLLDARAGRRGAAVVRLSLLGVVTLSNTVESGLLQQNGLVTLLLVLAVAVREDPLAAARRGRSAPWR